MNLVCDEGVPRPIVEHLRADGHHVLYIAELDPGIRDDEVLARTTDLAAPLITTDKDFGELVFRHGRASGGVLLLRLSGLSNDTKSRIVAAAIRDHSSEFVGAFAVISPVAFAYADRPMPHDRLRCLVACCIRRVAGLPAAVAIG